MHARAAEDSDARLDMSDIWLVIRGQNLGRGKVFSLFQIVQTCSEATPAFCAVRTGFHSRE